MPAKTARSLRLSEATWKKLAVIAGVLHASNRTDAIERLVNAKYAEIVDEIDNAVMALDSLPPEVHDAILDAME